MTLKEFFESGYKIAVHCDTEEKAKKLLEEFDKAGYHWCDGDRYLGDSRWYTYGEGTCYSNCGGYGNIYYYKDKGWQVVEFVKIKFEDTGGQMYNNNNNNNNLVNTPCAECGHRGVCGFKKGLEDLILDFKDGLSDDFTVEVRCKHFAGPMATNPFAPGYPNVTPLPFGQSYKGVVAPNPYEECPTGKRLQNGDVHIGDLPCEYCTNNPCKVTFKTTQKE